MYFVTCFDSAWRRNMRMFFGLTPALRGKQGELRYDKDSTRTFGYFLTRQDALRAVQQNCGDLHEHQYTLCVVERLGPGIPASASFANNESAFEPVWFEWQGDHDTGAWQRIERPEETERIHRFALG